MLQIWIFIYFVATNPPKVHLKVEQRPCLQDIQINAKPTQVVENVFEQNQLFPEQNLFLQNYEMEFISRDMKAHLHFTFIFPGKEKVKLNKFSMEE